MVTVGMNYNIIKGKEQEFESVFAKVLGVMQRMNGHKKTKLYRDVADPSSYLILSEWSAREAFDTFIASEQFRNVANWGKANILASQPKHDIYGDANSPPKECPAHHAG